MYTTTADRLAAEVRNAEHMETYGTGIPDRAAFLRSLAFYAVVIMAVVYLAACVINYASDLDRVAHMCAEVFANPGTEIPAACR